MRTSKRVIRSNLAVRGVQGKVLELREDPREVILIGINHRGVQVDLREKFSLDASDCCALLERILERFPDSEHGIIEAVSYSTCNRVEVVAAVMPGHSEAAYAHIEALISVHSGVSIKEFRAISYRLNGIAAVRHVFRVGAGLDSMVLGEPQVLGQLKSAYLLAHELGTTRAVLNRLFHRAFGVAKLVRTKTKIGQNAVSVCYAAKELATQIFGDLSKASLMLIGAGDTGALALKHFHSAGIKECYVVNKTLARAAALAEPIGAAAVELSHFHHLLPHADIVIGASALPQGSQPLISKQVVEEALRQRPGCAQFYIDLAVPRNFDESIERISDAFLYNVDDLKDVVAQNIDARSFEQQRADVLIDEEVESFARWLDARGLEPLIRSLHLGHQRFAKDEIAKTLRRMRREGFDAEQCDRLQTMLDSFSAAMIAKMLHRPLTKLKQTATDDQNLARYFEELFLKD